MEDGEGVVGTVLCTSEPTKRQRAWQAYCTMLSRVYTQGVPHLEDSLRSVARHAIAAVNAFDSEADAAGLIDLPVEVRQ